MPIKQFPIDVGRLQFDAANPRLDEDIGQDQQRIFRFLVDEIGVDDLLQSISSAGMLQGDPIIVREAEEKNTYYVIEGNRRLAAIKLLRGGKIADGNPEPVVPSITTELAESLRRVNVQTGWDPDALESYLGYKHVTAAREW